jgi:hypothetical protein
MRKWRGFIWETAQANERAALIQQAAAWRVLTPETKSQLLDGLKQGSGGSVEISYPGNDPEALFLATQIEAIFMQSNAGHASPPWNLRVQPRLFSRWLFFDLRIFGQKNDVVQIVREAFSGAQIPYTREPLPTGTVINDGPGMVVTGDAPLDVTIWVGSKRPPN